MQSGAFHAEKIKKILKQNKIEKITKACQDMLFIDNLCFVENFYLIFIANQLIANLFLLIASLF